MNDECTGPFSDAFNCPVHDPRKNAQTRPKSSWERRAEDAEARHTALLAALDALVANWRDIANELRDEYGADLSQDTPYRVCADRLAAEIAKHREAR